MRADFAPAGILAGLAPGRVVYGQRGFPASWERSERVKSVTFAALDVM
ncbi:hypothetical protein [Mycobacterium stomatepiae]|nr:hypothetical protein [Mycobacterium stomatepiae]MCV7163665.1 hypothetical protein [Mycobacterium stomatepiae]